MGIEPVTQKRVVTETAAGPSVALRLSRAPVLAREWAHAVLRGRLLLFLPSLLKGDFVVMELLSTPQKLLTESIHASGFDNQTLYPFGRRSCP